MNTAFAKELKEKLNQKQLLCTVTVTTKKELTLEAFDYPNIIKYFDFIHFKFQTNSLVFPDNFQNALEMRNTHNIQNVIDQSIKTLEVSPTKILIDINFGGLEMYLDPNSNFHYSILCGIYYICFKAQVNNYNITYNSEYGVAVAMNAENNHGFLIEGGRMMANKIRFAMRNNLAGAMVGGAGNYHCRCNFDDDMYEDYKSLVSGVALNIPTRADRHPLYVNILNEAITVALDEIEQEYQLLTKEKFIELLRTAKYNCNENLIHYEKGSDSINNNS